ncbi:glycine/betaine ABC transporter substrate-binding protein [Alphaproteobacteria bacterium]|jgi:glycine betaine/proline transport system substrate-binding protein|nr:glycine/betaine ABC transporter substrate-binding protein [Alphaproteobacteria bacterium]GIR67921.1 MAG: ABC transporter [Pelagibacteraceae bacterium]|tara:strand:+ start:2181 stop:3122 length:942 start_codon:yes stop_codon:yes gene_type:complete
MKKFISLFYALVLFAGFTTVAKAADPIRIPVLNWSSQIVMANVMAQAFEELGYDVELVPAESATRYEAVRVGELHVAHETWESTMALPFYEAMDKGGLIDAGSHDLITFEEMGVPNWVIEDGLCPGLPSWEALKSPECAANFATPDSEGKGRWLEGPYEWHTEVMPNRLKGLGIDDLWMVKFAGTADALWAELEAAKKEGRGTIIFNWSPNFTDAAGFTFIEFPPYFEGCRLEQGGSLETTGCGSPKGWLKKAAHIKFPITHTSAYKFYTKMEFTAPNIGEMANYVDNEGMTHAEAATAYIANNRDQIDLFMK